MIVLIDNYDSFTHNLVHAFARAAPDIRVSVHRNDKISVDALRQLNPTHLVISPGPRTPVQSGISCDAIRRFAGHIPILGVCLGHQCIADVAGAAIVAAPRLVHGKSDRITHDGRAIFRDVPNPFLAARYHSLIVDRSTLPADYEITAWTNHDEIMGIRHKTLPIEGVQFHPESFLTQHGPHLLQNFLTR